MLRLDLRRANGVHLDLQIIYVVSLGHIGSILAKTLSAMVMLAVWTLAWVMAVNVC